MERRRFWLWVGARLCIGFILVGWAASYLFPGSGEKEFQRAIESTRQVHSVRVTTVLDPTSTQHSDILFELACSQSASHFKWHMIESNPEHPAEVNRETLHVGLLRYELQPDSTWKEFTDLPGTTAKQTCARLADGTDDTVFPPFATMIKRGILQKGDKKTVNGVPCREWHVAMKLGAGLEHDSICLGLDDHLPYEMTVDWKHERTTYSDYNSSFQIEFLAGMASATN